MMSKKLALFIMMIALSVTGIISCQSDLDQVFGKNDYIATPIYMGSSEVDIKMGVHTTEAVGERESIVILADFPDVERQYSAEDISNRLLEKLGQYLYAASNQKFRFKGKVAGRYVLPNPVDDYRISPANLEVDRNKVLALVNDVVRLADGDVEFSQDLYVIIALGATNKEYGMVGYCAVPGMLGFTTESGITAPSGEKVGSVTVFCENAHMGTYVHDTLHQIGGVVDGRRMTPCLYDHDLQAKYAETFDVGKFAVNMGFWDPLSSHVPYDRSLPPAGLSSWTKLRLGWIDPAQIALVRPGETTTVRLDPLLGSEAEIRVIKIPISEFEYYLIENRQPIGSDVNLPASGILISHANDTVLECRHGNAPVKLVDASPEVPYLNGVAFDIGGNNTFLDAGHNLAIVLLQKVGMSYDIRITTTTQVSDFSQNGTNLTN